MGMDRFVVITKKHKSQSEEIKNNEHSGLVVE
jgi:hypothetical protein